MREFKELAGTLLMSPCVNHETKKRGLNHCQRLSVNSKL